MVILDHTKNNNCANPKLFGHTKKNLVIDYGDQKLVIEKIWSLILL
jgi:hypothetical protein